VAFRLLRLWAGVNNRFLCFFYFLVAVVAVVAVVLAAAVVAAAVEVVELTLSDGSTNSLVVREHLIVVAPVDLGTINPKELNVLAPRRVKLYVHDSVVGLHPLEEVVFMFKCYHPPGCVTFGKQCVSPVFHTFWWAFS
jgi:hypothetical protein